MREKNQPSKQVSFVRFGVLVVMACVISLMLPMGKVAAAEDTEAVYTSTESVLQKSYKELLNSLDVQEFGDYLSTLNTDKSYVIPGIDQTNIRNKKTCSGMIPQGICVAGEYLIISAYDASHKVVVDSQYKASRKQKSVLYVMDVDSRQYLTTITLNTKCHVGALAYNPNDELIYIADSDNGVVQSLSMNKIVERVKAGDDAHDDVLEFDGCAIDTQGYRPSLLSYYNGYVYVGQFAKREWKELFSNRIVAFDKDGTLLTQHGVAIPYCAQGVSFADWNNKTYMLVSSSYGRDELAKLSVYQMEKDKNGIVYSKKKVGEFSCPNMSEDIDIQGDHIYTCYESASNFYRLNLDENGESDNAVDRIMVSSFKKTIGRLLTGDEERFVHRICELPPRFARHRRVAMDVDDRRRLFLRLF